MRRTAVLVVLTAATWACCSGATGVRLYDPKGLHYSCPPGKAMRYCGFSICATKNCGPGTRCVENYCGTCEAVCKPIQPGSTCSIPKTLSPVCGKDGVTYQSSCHAARAGVQVARKGSCRSWNRCTCDLEYSPQCGSDGLMYINSCVSQLCARTKWAPKATCRASQEGPGCYCALRYDPVCGEDGVTYFSTCDAGCKGVKVAATGRCPCPYPCPKIYRPVCGSDGETYDNTCLAECARIPFTEGACPTTNCKVVGDVCTLAKPGECCAGLACEQYPIAKLNATTGNCWNTSLPTPIG